MDSVAWLVSAVKTAGQKALVFQEQLSFHRRTYKDDGSVLTEADQAIEEFLVSAIRQHIPEASIVGEEATQAVHHNQWTFVIDPIDGTDAFSQGMTHWCISVGVLNPSLVPVAGFIHVPALNLLLWNELGEPLTINGRSWKRVKPLDFMPEGANIMGASRIHHFVNMHPFPGKVRCFGSTAFHLCCPLLYPGVFGVVEHPKAHAWDIAGGHALLRSVGWDLRNYDDTPLNYAPLLQGEMLGQVVLAGPVQHRAMLREVIPLR